MNNLIISVYNKINKTAYPGLLMSRGFSLLANVWLFEAPMSVNTRLMSLSSCCVGKEKYKVKIFFKKNNQLHITMNYLRNTSKWSLAIYKLTGMSKLEGLKSRC